MTASLSQYSSEEVVSGVLQRLEERHDLLKHEFDGWCVWPMLRWSVGRAIQQAPLDQRGADGFSKRELLGFAMSDLADLVRVPRARYVVKTYASYHTEVIEARKKDVFFDDLLLQVGDWYKIEVINSRALHFDGLRYLIPRDVSSTAMALVADKLARRLPEKRLGAIATSLSRCLVQELGLAEFTPGFIVRCLSGFQWSKRLYRGVLARVRPQALMLAEVGDYPVTAAAKELGIPVVEFQHGIAHRHYPANSWTSYALPYKQRMAVPDRVFLFGPHWQREMAANGFWADELRSVGSLRVDAYRRKGLDRNDDVCTLLVTLQGMDTVRLIDFFADFVRLAEGRLAYRLVFKMHPVYQHSDHLFEAAFGANNRVELVSGVSLPSTFELLRQSHLHVSIFSACHYEALALGVPTVVLPMTGFENVEHLTASGDAVLARTPAELLDFALGWRDCQVSSGVGEEYFTQGAMRNMIAELECVRRGAAA